MKNKYRLSSDAFERETEEEKIQPQKIFFLSVEGNATEKEYLEGISAYRTQLGIHAIVDVQVLGRRRKDTNSAPQQVIELLEEYLQLRESGKESLIADIPSGFVEKYGEDFIRRYLEESDGISKRKKNEFVTDLLKIGYDINYRKYLQKYNSSLDEFGMIGMYKVILKLIWKNALSIVKNIIIPVILPIPVLNSGFCFICQTLRVSMQISLPISVKTKKYRIVTPS